MKRFAIIAAAGLMLGLAACKSNEKTTDAKAAPAAAAKADAKAAPAAAKTSPGAVNEKKSDCCAEKAKMDCCKDGAKKSECTDKTASPGAVSGNSGCPMSGGTCPFAGKTNG
jgi:hypothetical protein